MINRFRAVIIISAAAVLFSFLPSGLRAQGGSNYSVFGIGDINNSINAAYDALSGTCIALPDRNAINPKNPAMWSFVTSTRLQFGYKFNQNYVSNDNNDLWQNNGNIDGVTTVFSIDTALGISASFGLMPYSNVNYLISVPIKKSVSDLTLTGKTIYQGQGGLSTIYIGASAKILPGLYLGGTGFSNFGSISKSAVTSFNEDYTFSYTNMGEDFLTGFGFRGGLFYGGIKNLGMGLYFEKMSDLDVEQKVTYDSDVLSDTTFTGKFSIKMPTAAGFGLSYKTGKVTIGADYSLQNFNGFKYNAGSRDNDGRVIKFKNSSTMSLGLVREGNTSRSADYLDKVGYKFGLSYRQLYYDVVGNGINEFSGSFGMQMPVVGTGIIDASLAFGKRGTTTNGLINEYFGRLMIDISIGETWFKPFTRDF